MWASLGRILYYTFSVVTTPLGKQGHPTACRKLTGKLQAALATIARAEATTCTLGARNQQLCPADSTLEPFYTPDLSLELHHGRVNHQQAGGEGGQTLLLLKE